MRRCDVSPCASLRHFTLFSFGAGEFRRSRSNRISQIAERLGAVFPGRPPFLRLFEALAPGEPPFHLSQNLILMNQ